MKPRIFISAVTKELKTARQLVANTLLALGFEPVWQDIFETHSGDIRPMLREKLDTCSAVLQIVGDAYGAEPPAPDEQFGRVSYTQYEALYARSRSKKVYYLVAEANLPRDCPAEQLDLPREDSDLARTDSAVRKQLQQAYRANVQSTEHIFYAVQTESETELTVRRLNNILQQLHEEVRKWMQEVSAALFDPAHTRRQLESTILITFRLAVSEADKLTDWRKRDEAKELAKAQRDGNLARVDEFLRSIVSVINSGNASSEYHEVTRIFNDQGAEEAVAYIASRKQDLLAKSRASKAVNRQTNLLPILEQARKQVLLGHYNEARQTCDELLAEDPNWGDALHEQFWILVELGDRALRYESIPSAEKLFEESLEVARRMSHLREPHQETQRNIAISNSKLGFLLLNIGQSIQTLNYLENAHTIFQSLDSSKPDCQQAKRDLAGSYVQLGDFLFHQGNSQQALLNYELAHNILHTLTTEDSLDIRSRLDLAISHIKLSEVLWSLDLIKRSFGHFEAAFRIVASLASSEPRNIDLKLELLNLYKHLGEMSYNIKQLEIASGVYAQAVVECGDLADANPLNYSIQYSLAGFLDGLGDVLVDMGQLQSALTLYEDGFKIHCKLVDANPQDFNALGNWSLSHIRVGKLLLRIGQPKEAFKTFEAGRKYLAALATHDPLNYYLQSSLAELHYQLGKTLMQLGQSHQAMEHFTTARKIRLRLDYQRAVSAEGTEEEQRLRKEYRAKAIAALKEAIALGWNDFEHMRKDQDLTALHGDPEFEALFPKPPAEEKPAE